MESSERLSTWALQQDYVAFLALLGWMLAGLLVWGRRAGTTPGIPRLPWKLLAMAAFFHALRAGLQILFFMLPGGWLLPVDAAIGLGAAGFLLVFAYRCWHGEPEGRGGRFPWVLFALGLMGTAYFPVAGSMMVVVFAIGSALAAVLFLAGHLWSRRMWTLLPVAVGIGLLGPAEFFSEPMVLTLRGEVGVQPPLRGFLGAYGVLLHALAAWAVTAGFWMVRLGARRRRSETADPLHWTGIAFWVLPVLLMVSLVAGFFFVNWNGLRVQQRTERDYLFRVQTAALSVDAELVAALSFDREVIDQLAYGRLRRQLAAIRGANPDASQVYLWTLRDGEIYFHLDDGEAAERSRQGPVILHRSALEAELEAFARKEPFLWGPILNSRGLLMAAHARIMEPGTGETVSWLGMDLLADEWIATLSDARLQTISVMGLFCSLVIFFLYFQLRRESEADLVLAKEKAEAADRAKSEFLAVISHEIRTPLQSVLGYSELLSQTRLSGAQKGCLDTIQTQGRTLLRIVQDILDFSSLRKSSYELKAEPVALKRVVQETFDSLRPLAERKDLEYALTLDPRLPDSVLGDGVRIRQILGNLLGNALKFTPRGRVHLEVKLADILTGVAESMVRVRFRVEDTGIGIRREDLERMFEPFTQIGRSVHFPREGAGLGLAIVKRLCELMNGSIGVSSEPGEGTEFRVELILPLMDGEMSPPATEVSAASGEQEPEGFGVELASILPLQIMVADDNPYIRTLVDSYLKALGYRARLVDSGAQAVANWRGVDLILMDLRMPEMDGIEAVTRIRAESGVTDEPWIIGVSATLSETEVQRAMDAGCNDFLGKPFFSKSLVEAIQASPLVVRRRRDLARGEPEVAAVSAPDLAGDTTVNGEEERAATPVDAETEKIIGKDLIYLALDEIPVLLNDMSEALDNRDYERIRETSHYLSNTVLALRMEGLLEPCREVYRLAEEEDAAALPEALTVLNSCFADWKESRNS